MANHLDAFFAALADPTRRAVIETLTRGPAPVTHLHDGHAMALPSFVKHLDKLERAGLVRTVKQGRVRMVHLNPAPLAEAETWLSRQQGVWARRLDRLERLANDIEGDPQ